MRNLFLIAAALALMSGCTNLKEATETSPTYDTEFPPALNELNFQSHGKRLNGLIYLAEGPCLLYTSPSPRDRQQSRMPSSA